MVSTMVEICMDVDATKSKNVRLVTFICFRCLASSGFSLHIYLRIFPLGIDLYLECYAPARLTRVIAQASLGSPCGICAVTRVGWVGGNYTQAALLLQLRCDLRVFSFSRCFGKFIRRVVVTCSLSCETFSDVFRNMFFATSVLTRATSRWMSTCCSGCIHFTR